jgi:hypothetical protein
VQSQVNKSIADLVKQVQPNTQALQTFHSKCQQLAQAEFGTDGKLSISLHPLCVHFSTQKKVENSSIQSISPSEKFKLKAARANSEVRHMRNPTDGMVGNISDHF